MQHKEADTDGAGRAGSDRRPSVVPAPAATAPEMSDRPRRRTFTAQTKLRVLAETDGAAGIGGIGAILRREGLYSSTLTDWRRQRDSGASTAPSRLPKAGAAGTSPQPGLVVGHHEIDGAGEMDVLLPLRHHRHLQPQSRRLGWRPGCGTWCGSSNGK